MPAYLIATYDIVDPKRYESYLPGVRPLLAKHGAEALVADYAGRSLEGKAAGVNVVLRFPTEEAALAFYNDPAYPPVKQIRLDSTKNGMIVLDKQFVMPSA